MSESSSAVFLSYASQDAVAARRICEALRSRGIEVWFDQSELRGGDAWDQKIRQQIRNCALFIPIISANTAARHEGYFRLEWDLADQRTHKIARNRVFVFPVCIDSTADSSADVPESFVRVQWTRVPAGEAPPHFADRVLHLLSPNAGVSATHQSVPDHPAAPAQPHRVGVIRKQKVAVVLIAVAGAAVAGYFAVSAIKLDEAASPPTLQAAVVAPVAETVPNQSVAVLPFTDMSQEKDQEYFSDGLAEELIGQLSRIPELRVPARTSSFYFKGKAEDIAVIAQKLRVAHILEGSVRKAGQSLRVTVELIRADNGYHLWSDTYDRELKDVFKVQSEIATAVVAALKLQLAARPLAEAQHTHNSDALNQYLRGRQFERNATPEDWEHAVAAYRKAIELDPGYAEAYAALAVSEYNSTLRQSLDSPEMKRARAAAEKAIALAPDLAEGYSTRASLRLNIDWDWAGALEDFARARKLNPADAAIHRRFATLLGSLGRIPDAVAEARQAAAGDPLSANVWLTLAPLLVAEGNLPAAREAALRALEINPRSRFVAFTLGLVQLAANDPGAALATFGSIDDELFRETGVSMAQYSLHNDAESQRALAVIVAKYADEGAYQIAQVYACRGESDQALDWLERAYRQRDGGLLVIKTDPSFTALAKHPRMRALLRKMNLPE